MLLLLQGLSRWTGSCLECLGGIVEVGKKITRWKVMDALIVCLFACFRQYPKSGQHFVKGPVKKLYLSNVTGVI